MRAMSRQGRGGVKSPRFGRAAAEPEKKEEVKKEKPAPGSIPKWKQVQLEKEEAARKRQEEEERKRQEQAELIKLRVAEFGTGVNQEDEEVEAYLTSPRGEAEKPDVEKEVWEGEKDLPVKETADDEEPELEAQEFPSYDERGEDERAKKEEERLMKMIAGQM